MNITRLPDGRISVADAQPVESFAVELLEQMQETPSGVATYDGETVILTAINGTYRYKLAGAIDARAVRMERVE